MVLVDVTVLQHAVTHETAWITAFPLDGERDRDKVEYAARVPVHPYKADTRVYRSIEFLSGIVQLAKEGRIRLCTSPELEFEKLYQPSGRYLGYGSFDFSIFHDIELEHISSAISRPTGSSILNRSNVVQRLRERLSIAEAEFEDYAGLVKCLGRKNSQDAWHLFTVEHLGMFAYLTMDYKFLDALEAQAGNSIVKRIRPKAMTPEQLGRRFGIWRVLPHNLSYVNATFPVQADVHLPGGKRARLSQWLRGTQPTK